MRSSQTVSRIQSKIDELKKFAGHIQEQINKEETTKPKAASLFKRLIDIMSAIAAMEWTLKIPDNKRFNPPWFKDYPRPYLYGEKKKVEVPTEAVPIGETEEPVAETPVPVATEETPVKEKKEKDGQG